MTRAVLPALLCVLLLGCTGPPPSPPGSASSPSASGTTAAPAPSRPSTYLALGDSVAAGTGAPAGAGYVPLLAQRLRERLGCDAGAAPGCPLELRALAVEGATTATLIAEQLPVALQVMQGSADVRLVTVTVGGNDVFEPVLRGCAPAPASAGCRAAVRDALARADAGLNRALTALAAAATPSTTLAVMTYYDPVPACRLAPLAPLAQQVLEGSAAQPGLNDVLRTRAGQHGAVVVETAGRLRAPQDFVGDRDCLHPSAIGHARIAEAFDDLVGAAAAGG